MKLNVDERRETKDERVPVKKLGEVCVSKSGIGRALKTFDSSDEILYVDIASIDNQKHGITSYTQTKMCDAPSRAQQCLKKKDVLVSLVRPNLKNVAIVDDEKNNLVASSGFCVLRADKDILPQYVFLFVCSEKFTDYLVGLTAGANYPAVREDDVRNAVLPVPPLDEQSRIVAELDLLTGIIDKQNAQLKELDNLAQAIFYDMFGDPIENPKGWEVKLWGDLFDTILGKMLDAKKQNPNDTIRSYLGNTNVQWFSFDLTTLKTMTFSAKEMEKFALRKGDILLCEGGESGRCAVWENDNSLVLFQKAIHRARVKDKALIESHFIPFVIKLMREMGGLKNFVSKATIEHLTGEKLAQVPIILPPLALQQSFAEKIQSIEKQKETIRASIADTQKLLDYTMDKYFG